MATMLPLIPVPTTLGCKHLALLCLPFRTHLWLPATTPNSGWTEPKGALLGGGSESQHNAQVYLQAPESSADISRYPALGWETWGTESCKAHVPAQILSLLAGRP